MAMGAGVAMDVCVDLWMCVLIEWGGDTGGMNVYINWMQWLAQCARGLIVYFKVSVCCSVLQCNAVCCKVLQCVAVVCSLCSWIDRLLLGLFVLQCVAECCRELQSVAVCCSVMHCTAVCGSV